MRSKSTNIQDFRSQMTKVNKSFSSAKRVNFFRWICHPLRKKMIGDIVFYAKYHFCLLKLSLALFLQK